MDEDSSVSHETPEYKDNDVVWVKLGSSWWPAEVVAPEKLPDDLSEFKKPPLAVVRFFDEDKYEYIRSWSHIYPYNCERKNEFIKKGMAAFRNKSTLMGKFPVDVSCAEVKSGGNASILSDPMFLPEKKVNYVAEVFKTPTQKKGLKEADDRRGRPKKNLNIYKGSDIPASENFQITHRRFLGFDDYKAYICIQSIGKDRDPEPGDEEAKDLNSDPKELFHCHSCTYVTRSTELMVMHCKSHIQGIYIPSKKPLKITSTSLDYASGSGSERSPVKRKRITEKLDRSKKSTGSPAKRKRSSEKKEKNTESPVKRKRASEKVKRPKKEQPPVLDIRSDLLAEWDDSDEDNEEIVSSLKNKNKNEDSFEEIESENDESAEKTVKNDEIAEIIGGNKLPKTAEDDKEVNKDEEEVKKCDIEVNKGDTEGNKGDKQVHEDDIMANEDEEKIVEEINQDDKEVNGQDEEVHKKDKEDSEQDKKFNEQDKEVNEEDKEFNKEDQEVNEEDKEVTQQDKGVDQQDKEVNQQDKEINKQGEEINQQSKDIKKQNKDVNKDNEEVNEQDKEVNKVDQEINKQDNLVSTDEKEVTKAGKDVNKGKKIVKKDEKAKKSTQDEIKSCFDFDDDDDMHQEIVAVATSGRKIPRVIPEIRKSLTEIDTNLDITDETLPKSTENEDALELNRQKILEESEKLNLKVCHQDSLDEEFKDLMDSTTVPDLPEITPNILKPEQNFHDGNTVKFPDKPEVDGGSKSPPHATKLTSPKKRFVKSFEDFELEMKRKGEEGKLLEHYSDEMADISNNEMEDISNKEMVNDIKKDMEDIRNKEMVDNINKDIEDISNKEMDDISKTTAEVFVVTTKQQQQEIRCHIALELETQEKILHSEQIVPIKGVEIEEEEEPKEEVKPEEEEETLVPKNLQALPGKPGRRPRRPQKKERSFQFGQRWSTRNIKSHKLEPPSVDVKVNESEKIHEALKVVEEPTHTESIEEVTKEEELRLTDAEAPEKPVKIVKEKVVLEPKTKKKRGKRGRRRKHSRSKTAAQTSSSEDTTLEASTIGDVATETPKIEDVASETPKIEDVAPVEPSNIEDVAMEPSNIEDVAIETSIIEEDVTIETSKSEDIDVQTSEVAIEVTITEDVASETLKTEDTILQTSVIEETIVETAVEENMVETLKLEDTVVETPKIEDITVETSKNDDQPSVATETTPADIDEIIHPPVTHLEEETRKEEKQLPVAMETISEDVDAVPEAITAQDEGSSSREENEVMRTHLSLDHIKPVKKEVGLPEVAAGQSEENNVDVPLTTSEKLEVNIDEASSKEKEDEIDVMLLPKFEKLKDRILAKISEETHTPKKLKKGQPKTAKIKILESYRQKQEEASKSNETFDEFDEKPSKYSFDDISGKSSFDDISEKSGFDDMSGKSGFDFSLNDSDASLRMTVQNIIDSILPEEDEEKPKTTEEEKPIEEKFRLSEKEEIIFPPKKNIHKMDDYKSATSKITMLPKKKRRKTIEERTVSPDLFSITPPPKKKIFAYPRAKGATAEDVNVESGETTSKNEDGALKSDDKTFKNEGGAFKKQDAVAKGKKPVKPKPISEIPENVTEVAKSTLADVRETFDLGEMLADNKDSYPIEERLLHLQEDAESSQKSTPEEFVGHKQDNEKLLQRSDSVDEMESYNKHDDFSPIGNASFELPEDAICLPSRRSTRRKTSEELLHHKSEESAILKRKNEETILPKGGGKRKRKSTSISEPSVVAEEKIVQETPTIIPEEQIEVEQIPIESEEIIEETVVTSDNIIEEDHKNEMEVKLTNNTEDGDDDFKFSIQTNLTNFSKVEEMSAVALATLSEIQAEKKQIETECIEKKKHPAVKFPLPTEAELVQVEGNVTVMSEKDLVDSQVEITPDKIISSKKKPVTLASFSMDFDQQKTTPKPVSKASQEKSATKNNGTEFSSRAMTNKVEKLHNDKSKRYERMELLDILEGNSDSSSSSCDQKFKESFDAYNKKDIVQGICDFEECIPQQIVVAKPKESTPETEDEPKEPKKPVKPPSKRSKLLERLTVPKLLPEKVGKVAVTPPSQVSLNLKVNETIAKGLTSPTGAISKVLVTATRTTPTGAKQPAKFVIKTTRPPVGATNKGTKPIILSEQIIKPTNTKSPVDTSVKPTFEDVEDVEAFVIPKVTKKVTPEEDTGAKKSSANTKVSGKAKILHQTIITAEGEIIQPSDASAATAQTDFNVFDINSMPIVLSDQILTPESIENMPIMLGSDEKVITPVAPATPAKKIVTTSANLQPKVTLASPIVSGRTPATVVSKATKPRILQSTTKAKANSPLLPNTVKAAKYIIVPSNPATSLPQGKVLIPANVTSVTAGKQVLTTKTVVRKAGQAGQMISTKVSGAASPGSSDGASGNKIMIFTNQQGQQHRLLLTPQQQKMLGYQTTTAQPAKVTTKTIVKSGVIPKGLIGVEGAAAGPSGILTKSLGVQQRVTSAVAQPNVTQSGLLIPGSQSIRMTKTVTKRASGQRAGQKQQKTILIKNQHGQTVRKIQGTDDAELDKQVAEQLEAIKASARLMHNKTPEVLSYTKQSTTPKTTVRRSVTKKTEVPPKKQISVGASSKFSIESSVPALTPIPTNKKSISSSDLLASSSVESALLPNQQQQLATTATKPQAASNTTAASVVTKQQSIETNASSSKTSSQQQLVIQDALGNQTTVAVGQILALPSETVDGQPQSYMLVTLDESGNLTPLNNEALMSLDPSLGMNFDVNNMVLEMDQNKATLVSNPAASAEQAAPKVVTDVEPKPVVQQTPVVTSVPAIEPFTKGVVTQEQQQQIVAPPAVAGKEIVAQQQQPQTGGQQLIVTGDPIATQKFLESLSEGTTDLANILANAEGSSILIQTDGQQILINTNSDNQMLLNVAENTEAGGNPIFSTQPSKNQDILAAALADTDVFQQEQHPTQKLSPNSTLYPMNVSNVLETSLTLGSPIMTPLEVPSTNSKKIEDSTDILSQVPKNVDLPITITDPNISQTVAQQHVANLMASELPAMELSLPISEATISVTSTEMSSPSFVYSLPSLDDTVVDMSTPSTSKPSFNSSMPLLTEDHEDDAATKSGGMKDTAASTSTVTTRPSFVEDQEEGLCTLGGQICSSLSEPPPDMFDLPDVDGASFSRKQQAQVPQDGDEEISSDLSSAQAETSSVNSEGSCEIPLQPNITVSLNDLEPRPRRVEEENGPSGNHKMDAD